MPVGAAIGGAGILGAGASIYGANKAAGAASDAAAMNNALLEKIYGENKELLSPFIGYGTKAGGMIAALLGLGGDEAGAEKAFDAYKGSTGYEFTLKSGTDAIGSNAATKGLLNSGANLKNISNFGQQTGQQYFNSFLQQLLGQEQIGVGAGSALAGQGMQMAGMQSANNNSAASATGNAWLSGAGSINNLLGSLAGTYGLTQGLSSFGAGGGATFGIPAEYAGLI